MSPRPPPRLRRPPSRARSFSRARCTRATPAVPWLHPEPRVHTAPLPIPAPPCLRVSVRGYIHVPTAWPAQLTPDNLTVAGAGAFAGAGAGVGVHRSAGMCGGRACTAGTPPAPAHTLLASAGRPARRSKTTPTHPRIAAAIAVGSRIAAVLTSAMGVGVRGIGGSPHTCHCRWTTSSGRWCARCRGTVRLLPRWHGIPAARSSLRPAAGA